MKSLRFSLMAAAAVVALLGPHPALAQERAVVFSARGGGFSALSNLNDAGTADFKTGFNVGGGVGVQVHKYVVLDGDFTWGQREYRSNGVDSGIKVNQFFYGGAVKLQYPAASGFTPYVLGGGGAVTFHQRGTSGVDKTKGFGRFGAGLSYRIPRSNWALYGQGDGFVYKVSNFDGGTALTGFAKTQVDIVYSGGVSYRLSF
jgi:outer membrane protein with beta-barrel domain